MEKSVFYREVAHRTECLQMSVSRMAVARWCDSPEHREALWQICRDTAAFMVPPAEDGGTGLEKGALGAVAGDVSGCTPSVAGAFRWGGAA
ncbi:hypothetical protein NF320_004315 [Salmonella enterica]|nr:hypothetical protein [Salmonella enterica]EBB4776021.1 hypothetical protein [Salmonella enterica subsp. enterica serovar Typhimurium]ECS6494224.1 hypothetical protein [Salmonella enterica subsp. enterica serovar Herston]ECS8253948.1 hypothetical protein [Salmonella enterica subsp. enterica serovar Waycross]EDV1680088.1 hypothetical protein [Salmonella enterica subsp. enterica serovar Monschaui]